MSEQGTYTVYVVKDAILGPTGIEETPCRTKADAMRTYRERASVYAVEDGYEVCVYADDDMIASTWPAP